MEVTYVYFITSYHPDSNTFLYTARLLTTTRDWSTICVIVGQCIASKQLVHQVSAQLPDSLNGPIWLICRIRYVTDSRIFPFSAPLNQRCFRLSFFRFTTAPMTTNVPTRRGIDWSRMMGAYIHHISVFCSMWDLPWRCKRGGWVLTIAIGKGLCFLKSRSVIFPFYFLCLRSNHRLWSIHFSWLLRLTLISDFGHSYFTYRPPFFCFPVPSKAFSFHLSFSHRIMIEGHRRPTRMGSSSHAHLMLHCVLLKDKGNEQSCPLFGPLR